MSNYPPVMTTGYMGTDEVTQRCMVCGRRWNSVIRGELGAWYNVDETAASCPACGPWHDRFAAVANWLAYRNLWLANRTRWWPWLSRSLHAAWIGWYSHCDPEQVTYDPKLRTMVWQRYLDAEEKVLRDLEGGK